ncbi:gamma-interferon-inducible lysosomal thiol reductase 1 [Megachile rotundata]|uniref:gamma-interferon-inducible lysosomal thiol reductase 1 n=1 Tax=Megachile rotundata TaxID=143995 RepID=UPI003FD151C3
MRYYLFTSSSTLAVFFVFHTALVAGAGLSNNVVNVGVYYESLCPDSIRFIKNGLVPTYNALGSNLDVTLVPYGKASHKLNAGEWQFNCQHGPEECQGNMAQACGLHAIQNKEPAEKVQQLSVALVGCVMSSRHPASSVPQCAESVGLNEQAKTSIEQCLNSPLSKELLAANGDKTDALNPRLSFVPTITINGVTSQEIQNKALSNFQKLICDTLPANSNSKCA